jgi:hypothetical protein
VLKLVLVRTQAVFLSGAGQTFQSALATMVSATVFRSVLEGLSAAESCVEALAPTQPAMVLLGAELPPEAPPTLVTLTVTDAYSCVEV